MITKHKSIVTVEKGKLEIYIEREFDAPPEVIFKAYTDPKIYAKWIGPRELTTKIEKFEARDGGSWRFIQTFEFESLPETGHVILDTTRFELIPGDKTKVYSQSVFQSVEDRDGMMQADMEKGIEEGFERLDELLERMNR